MRKIDRFIKYLEYKGISENKATVECGLSVGLIGQAKRGKSDLGEKAIDKILNKYLELSKVWLLTGEGKMLKEDYSTQTRPAATQMEFDFNRWMINEEKKTACLQELTNTNSRLVSMLNQAMSGKNESMQNQIDELSRRIERFLESLSQRRAKDAM